jgi:glycosyltransferase involved in cell wall biosynthesis
VKEATALTDAGYDVYVLFTQMVEYLKAHDRAILQAHRALKAVWLDWTDRGLLPRFRRLSGKVLQLIDPAPEVWLNRQYRRQLRQAVRIGADLYIGHNLGALPVVVRAAEITGGRCGFDAEDLHRYETSGDERDERVSRKMVLEDRYLPRVGYLTASSAEIAAVYRGLYPQLDPVTVRNVFPTEHGIPPPAAKGDGPVRLFWFSQTIGLNRGLQDVVRALDAAAPGEFELHLLGNRADQVRSALLAGGGVPVFFYPPMPAAELPGFAAQFDVGLALEPGFSPNNEIALSNKLFTYLQAGLALVVSDTPAQKNFLEAYPAAGRSYRRGDAAALAEILRDYRRDRAALLRARLAAFRLARLELNWETEQQAFLATVAKILEQP